MKKIIVFSCFLLGSMATQAQLDLNNVLNTAGSVLNGSGASLSNDEVIKGLKEALSVGTNKSTSLASKMDGFNKNSQIRIPWPKDAQVMANSLRSVGMGSQVDNLVLQLNRAAEEAAKKAAPIFLAAITSMSITDGFGILKGSDNAATKYLSDKTTTQLKTEFKPVVRDAMNKVGIAKLWNPLMTRYNKIPMVQKVNPNLEDYVTLKAIEGLFKLVGAEELKIRKDPGARVSDILKKVFG